MASRCQKLIAPTFSASRQRAENILGVPCCMCCHVCRKRALASIALKVLHASQQPVNFARRQSNMCHDDAPAARSAAPTTPYHKAGSVRSNRSAVGWAKKAASAPSNAGASSSYENGTPSARGRKIFVYVIGGITHRCAPTCRHMPSPAQLLLSPESVTGHQPLI